MSAKQVRTGIGADIIITMTANDEFPVANVYRLSKTMMEYFESEGFEDTLNDYGYSWRPCAEYWQHHLSDIRAMLRKERKLYLEFVRDNENGEFKGAWTFVKKKAFEDVMSKERVGLETRTETFNERLEDGYEKWQLSIPGINLETLMIQK